MKIYNNITSLLLKAFVIILGSFSIQKSNGQQTNLRLWYTQPATEWTEALPLGNGRIGAMVFGGIKTDRIQFNEETLWTGGPRNYNNPNAHLWLDTIRNLVFAGKQKQAETLAQQHFMGNLSPAGDQAGWTKEILAGKGITGNPADEKYNDAAWKTMPVPAYEGWETVGYEGLDGAVWFRTNVEVPDEWLNTDLVLDLNRMRDIDYTYINGQLVGSTVGADPTRKYTIPKQLLHKGKNSIAILILNFYGKGGIGGFKDTSRHIGIYPANADRSQMKSINGNWKFFVQNDEPPARGSYQADYQPFGDLLLHFKGSETATNYERSLNLENALLTTKYSQNGIQYQREYLVSQPQQAMAIKLSASQKGAISFAAELSSPHKQFVVKKSGPQGLALSFQVRHGALKGEAWLHINTKGGKVTVQNNQLVVANADEAFVYLVAATNFKNYNDVSGNPNLLCQQAIKPLQTLAYSVIRSRHISEYQSYFKRFYINLGHDKQHDVPTNERIKQFATSNDPAFLALYLQYGRYLLIASSRPGTKPANLQGIWNDLLAPPWGSKYTTNINAEMNYWPAELLNLSALHEPLFGMIDELAKTGKVTAKSYYNAPGWVLHHNTDLWRGTAPINASNHGIWPTGGAWLCHHLWERFQFTADTQFLRQKAYPIMKEAALFFNHTLIKDPVSGYLISTPSNSPEQGGLVAGPTMDHQIIRSLFNSVVKAAQILNVDAALSQQLAAKAQQIAPNKIGRYGQLQEWMQDVDDTTNKHRHVSHLWAVYPGNEISWRNADMMKAARQSLLYRGDAATGWSLGWKVNFWARFKEGDHVVQMLKLLLSPASTGQAGSYPNLFDAHPPFQIDGNFGAAAGIAEMLVQSHVGAIDILPALPTNLSEGNIKGLCVRGGFELDLQWKNGVLEKGVLHSKKGLTANLVYGQKSKTIKTTKGKRYAFNGNLDLQ